MSLLVGLESQPQFPRQDLTDTNAELLELMLANAGIVHDAHAAAENAIWLYKVAHPAMRFAGQRVPALESRVQVFNHGVSTYEAIVALVQGTPSTLNLHAVGANAMAIGSTLDERDLLNYIEGARERFDAETPRTAEVVAHSSARFFHSAGGYAVFGAALARQFELDATI